MTNSLIDGRCCNFCGKQPHEVNKLIAGPQVFICDECVSLSVGIINSSDNTYIHKIRSEIKGDQQMKKAGMRAIDAPDEFWNLMDQEDVYRRMATGILQTDIDLSDHLSERAYNFMNKARVAGKAAWSLIHETYPDTEGKQMSAATGVRKVFVEQ